MCSFILSASDAYCLTFKYNNISEVNIETPKKPKLTFIDKVYFGHSKRKQELGGVNCIFNDGNYLLLGTETGLVRFNKRNYRSERISSKRYNIQKVVKDKGVYWMVVEDNILEKGKLVKYRNGIFSTIYKAKESVLSFDVLKSGKNEGVWIIKEENGAGYKDKFGNFCSTKKFIVKNTLSGLKKSSFMLDAGIFDYRTDNKGTLWIASSKGIYEISLGKKNKLISNRFEYITKKLQILNNSNTVHFISGDTLYSIDDSKLNIKEYRLGISGTIYVNNSYLKHIENIGVDDNACTSGIIEIKESTMKIFNESGLVNDTGKVLNLLKEHLNEDYMDYVKTYNILPNGNFIFLVSGHGRAVHCFDGVYMFDGEKAVQIGYLTSSEQMIIDRNRVWIPDGADWHMVPKGIGGGLYLYEY
ncbi:MAG: hypothetical protein NTY74_08555 [Ignavibacteriae bacterium]|nr:hypothetical protein [Ignavibacteriota bacterium]